MTASSAVLAPAGRSDADVAIVPNPGLTGGDRVFTFVLWGAAAVVLVLLVLMNVYLASHSMPALEHSGLSFFFSDHWAPPVYFGILGALVGSVVIAVMASVVALPISVATALMINEYAPQRVRPVLTATVDLLATVPSIVYGFWGLEAMTHFVHGSTVWLATHASFIPFLRSYEPGTYGNSIFICGLVVGIMIIPIVTSISREVMARAPREACEGALALGGTRLGMVTDVILPFSRNGIIGGVLLGMGRALGETMAVYLILSTNNVLTAKILGPNGLGSISRLIGVFFESVSTIPKSALTLAGLTLFATTLVINLLARLVVSRADRGRA